MYRTIRRRGEPRKKDAVVVGEYKREKGRRGRKLAGGVFWQQRKKISKEMAEPPIHLMGPGDFRPPFVLAGSFCCLLLAWERLCTGAKNNDGAITEVIKVHIIV